MATRIDMLRALGTVTFDEIDPPKGQTPTEFTAYLTKAPIVTAGYGGWSRVARPHKKALTEWVGRDSISITCEILLDTLDDNQGVFVEQSISYLEYLAAVGQNIPQPPLFQLKSNPDPLMPHGFHRTEWAKWFIDSITWDADSVIVNDSGNRVRAAGTVVVTQYVEDERLSAISVAQKKKAAGGKKQGGKRKTYTVKSGDTLSKIAARKDVYGDAKQWKKIAKANGIRDPKKIKKGQVLKIP